MYNNLIFFLVVLMVFTTYQPGTSPPFPWWVCLGLIVGMFFLFWSGSRVWIKRLGQRLDAGRGGPAGPAFQKIQTRLSVLALFLFTLDVHLFGLKDLIEAGPVLGRSAAFSGLAGLAAFAVFLAALWAESYSVYRRVYNTGLSRGRFVWSQLRFNIPVVLPFLILSLVEDVMGLLPRSGLREWLDSPLGDLTFYLVFVSGLVVFFPLLIRPLWGLQPLPASPLRASMESFCGKHGFAYREIMLWPLYEGEGLTAGVMGLAGRWRYILVTKSLLRILDPGELEAVLAHELGHVKKRHLFYYLLFFVLFFILLTHALGPILFDFGLYLALLTPPVRDVLLSPEPGGGAALSAALIVPTLVLVILYFRFILGAFMRNFERQADLFAFGLTGTIKGLVNSLEKIALYSGQSRRAPSWHHYSIAERVDFLERCRVEPDLARGHERKVLLMMVAYFVALAVLGAGSFLAHRQFLETQLTSNLAVAVFQAEIKRRPGNVEAYRGLGDVLFQDGRLDEAIAAYESAALLGPNDPETLNNLAWTLITRPGSSRRDQERGLSLAQAAAGLKDASHILDTLAEAWFVNGRPDLAVEFIDRALALAGPRDDLEYFRRQRRKFLAWNGDN
ncbi:MAG: M48 family metalloprotease [Pseudomonadota bacterium]